MLLDLPPQYRDKGDGVSYVIVDVDGTRRVYDSGYCYGVVLHNRSSLPNYDFLCRPTRGRNSAPLLVFQRFLRLLRRHHIIVPDCRPAVLNGENTLFIPRGDRGYHPLFVTLSMYRHADIHGKSVLGRTMRAYAELQLRGVHFLQCLHWALANTSYGTWHSCINLSNNQDPYGGGRGRQARDLRWGLALAVYSQLSWENKKHLAHAQATDMFDSLARTLRPFPIEHQDEILEPRYSKFYRDPHKARQ